MCVRVCIAGASECWCCRIMARSSRAVLLPLILVVVVVVFFASSSDQRRAFTLSHRRRSISTSIDNATHHHSSNATAAVNDTNYTNDTNATNQRVVFTDSAGNVVVDDVEYDVYDDAVETEWYIIVFLSFLYGTISIVSVVGNGLIICAVLLNKRMHNVTNYFISNLALADVVIGLFAAPFQVVASSQTTTTYNYL